MQACHDGYETLCRRAGERNETGSRACPGDLRQVDGCSPKGKGDKQKKDEVEGAEKDSWDEAALEFVEGRDCRRIVLGRVMDGRMDRWECEEGEERCDVCQRRGGIWEEEAVAGVADEGERATEAGQRLSEVEEEMAEGGEGLVDAIEEEFTEADRTRAFAQ